MKGKERKRAARGTGQGEVQGRAEKYRDGQGRAGKDKEGQGRAGNDKEGQEMA